MLSQNQLSAVAALDAARPVVARLDVARHPDDVAADLIESWGAAETALRLLLGGSSLDGQALVSEVRQRGLLDYPHAHALLGFLAARDRVGRPDYRPTESDVDAARAGFQAIEAALGVGIGANTATYPAVHGAAAGIGTPPPPPPTPPLSPSRTSRGAAPPPPAPAAPATTPPPTAYVPTTPTSRRGGAGLIVGLVLVALLAGAGWWAWSRRGDPASLADGIAAFQRGDRPTARRLLEQAVIDRPKLARPHIYLARLARDDGDRARANSELTTAINLEPENALAMREMGQLQLQSGNFPLAVRFFERALRIDANDRVAQGWMGCALQRQGQTELAGRFFQRAGNGDWSACQQAAPVVMTPGAIPGAGTLPPPLPRP